MMSHHEAVDEFVANALGLGDEIVGPFPRNYERNPTQDAATELVVISVLASPFSTLRTIICHDRPLCP
jgi:hypothetical protein